MFKLFYYCLLNKYRNNLLFDYEMPPLKSGLIKRKIQKEATSEPDECSEDNLELFRGELDDGDDSSDSEQDGERSDGEDDQVIYASEEDSLGDGGSGTEESSDLTDSEDSGPESAPEEQTHLGDDQGAITRFRKQLDEEHKELVLKKDEYESGDTSDEEERLNTRGAVPSCWYDEYPHVGYDVDGRRIMKPPQRDQIDDFLKKCEDPEFWRTVKDPSTGQDIVLSLEDLKLIQAIKEGRTPSEEGHYEPWVEWFTREVLVCPVRAIPEHKRSFLPSESEKKQIAKIVHALRMGWTKTRRQLAKERKQKKIKKFYDLWGSTNEDKQSSILRRHIPAPKRNLPSHAESYNPPPEYLLDGKEMKEWNKLSTTPWKRKYTFLPEKHDSLRRVGAFPRFVRERFLRCLDLYLAPRAMAMKLTVTAEDLVPHLPSPRSLRPFPTSEVLVFRGHSAPVRCCAFDPSGQYVVSGAEDATVRVWETATGRCLRTISVPTAVTAVQWSPSPGLALVAACCGHELILLNPGRDIGAPRAADRTDRLLRDPPPPHDQAEDPRVTAVARWEEPNSEDRERGIRIKVVHFRPIIHMCWHGRGDYLVVSLGDAMSRGVVVHQLSRRRSQLPLARSRGLLQAAVLHPTRPLLFVATQRAVRVYDLVKQQLVRKLLAGVQWISDIALHPQGDNLLAASYDRKLVWFDLDLSSKPYQTLRLHGQAVRSVTFHTRYPLFASGGDDRYIVVSHAMVYNDLLQNPLLVPLKQLPSPDRIWCVRFHPTRPWLLAAASDNTLRLYS